MQQNPDKSHSDDHDLPPNDEAARNKIDKHLSDINDTISEEDIKNMNTGTGGEKGPVTPGNHSHDKTEADEILNDDTNDDDDEPEKEAPTPWEILK